MSEIVSGVNTASDSHQYNTIDLIGFAGFAWKNKLIIIACAFFAAIIAFINVAYFKDDTYTATAMLYVSNKTEISEKADQVQQGDIDAARKMTATYKEVFRTRDFLKNVSAAVDNKYSWKTIKSMMSISSVNETEFLSISVTADNPAVAYELATAVIEEAPVKFKTIFKGGEVEIVDPPEFPEAPNGKQAVKNIIFGLIIGFFIGAAICFAIYFFDNTIHKSEDIAKRYNISILGELAQ